MAEKTHVCSNRSLPIAVVARLPAAVSGPCEAFTFSSVAVKDRTNVRAYRGTFVRQAAYVPGALRRQPRITISVGRNMCQRAKSHINKVDRVEGVYTHLR